MGDEYPFQQNCARQRDWQGLEGEWIPISNKMMRDSVISGVGRKSIQKSGAWMCSCEEAWDYAQQAGVAMAMRWRRRGQVRSHETTGDFYIDVIQWNRWGAEDVWRERNSAMRERKISEVEFVRQSWKKRMADHACMQVSLAGDGVRIKNIQVSSFESAYSVIKWMST